MNAEDFYEEFWLPFSQQVSARQLSARLGKTLSRLMPCALWAVFVPDGPRLRADAYPAERQADFEKAALTALQEPLVEECWARQKASWGPLASGPERIFEHGFGAAFPLGGYGVVLMEKADFPFPAEEIRSALWVSNQVAPLLAEASRREATQARLLAAEGRVRELSMWSEGALTLLQGQVDTEFNLAGLVRILESIAHRLVPDMAVWLEWQRSAHWQSAGQPLPGLAPTLRESLASWEEPLWLPELQQTSWKAEGGVHCLWACPLRTRSRLSGFLALHSSRPVHLDRSERDLLALLAAQVGASLDSILLHEQLQDSQVQMLQQSKLAGMGQLAAGVAHELNTPLGTAMISVEGAEINLQRGKTEAALPKLQLARQELVRAREIIAQLLHYSRTAEKGRTALDLADIARDGGRLLQASLGGQCALHLELQAGPARGNANELLQVVLNLLFNARDAIEEGGQIQLRSGREGQESYLEVEDSGAGVAPESAERIFEPFFTTKAVGKGTGLGLALSRTIVEKHGGRLQLADRSRFRLTLPAL